MRDGADSLSSEPLEMENVTSELVADKEEDQRGAANLDWGMGEIALEPSEGVNVFRSQLTQHSRCPTY